LTLKISDDLFLVSTAVNFQVLPACTIHVYGRKCSGLAYLWYIAKFLDDTFILLSSYFRVHPITLLLEILGGRMH